VALLPLSLPVIVNIDRFAAFCSARPLALSGHRKKVLF